MTADPARRLGQHVAGKSLLTSRRVAEIAADGAAPVMKLFGEYPDAVAAHAVEMALIRKYTERRHPLVNNRFGRSLSDRMKSHGRAWSEDDKRQVAEMFASGISPLVIAAALGRSKSGVRGILRRMGLIE